MIRWIDISHSDKVGSEYEVAKGETVYNMGERRCIMKIQATSQEELQISFQVVQGVQKPLLAVSSMVKLGHEVVFSEANPRIVLSSGQVVPMRAAHGTFELDVYVKKPGFTRQSRAR